MPKVRHRQSSVVLPTFPRPSVHFCSCLVLVLQCKVFFFSHSRKTAKLGNGPAASVLRWRRHRRMAAAGGPDGGGTLHCCVDAFDHERQRHPSSPSAAQSPASPFAALDCVDCPPVGRAGEGGEASGGAILRHPLLSRLNGYCLVDFVSLAEDLAIITIVRTNRVGRWRTRLLKVFLLLPYGVHVAEFLCARLRPLRYPNAVIPPLSEVVQAVLFVRIAGETYQSVAVFVAFAAVQITRELLRYACLSCKLL